MAGLRPLFTAGSERKLTLKYFAVGVRLSQRQEPETLRWAKAGEQDHISAKQCSAVLALTGGGCRGREQRDVLGGILLNWSGGQLILFLASFVRDEEPDWATLGRKVKLTVLEGDSVCFPRLIRLVSLLALWRVEALQSPQNGRDVFRRTL